MKVQIKTAVKIFIEERLLFLNKASGRTKLRYIAKHHSLNLWSNGHSFHMLTKQKMRPNLAMIAYCVSKVGFDQLIKKLMFSLTLSDCKKLKNSDKEPTKEIF